MTADFPSSLSGLVLLWDSLHQPIPKGEHCVPRSHSPEPVICIDPEEHTLSSIANGNFRYFAVKPVTWELMGRDTVGWMELGPGVSTLAEKKAAPYLQCTQTVNLVSASAQIEEKFFLSK